MTLLRGLFVQRDGSNNGTTPKGARLGLGGLLGRSNTGTVRPGVFLDDMSPVVSGNGDMTYTVRPFVAAAKFSDANGPVVFANDAPVSVSTTTSPGSNSRIDLVCAIQRLISADGGSGSVNVAEIVVVQGNVAAVPVAPATPAGAVALARVRVTANASSTVGLTFERAHDWLPANGGIVPDAAGSIVGRVWDGSSMAAVGLGDTNWLTPTPGTSVNLNPTWGEPGTRYKRIGMEAWIKVECVLTAARPAGWVVCTIPSSIAPSVRMPIPLMQGGGAFYCWGNVMPNGQVLSTLAANSGGQVVGAVNWPIGG